jgi:hypothetical protein
VVQTYIQTYYLQEIREETGEMKSTNTLDINKLSVSAAGTSRSTSPLVAASSALKQQQQTQKLCPPPPATARVIQNVTIFGNKSLKQIYLDQAVHCFSRS